MEDSLRRHIINRLGNDVQNLDYVLQHFKPVIAKRGTQLLKAGDVCRINTFVSMSALERIKWLMVHRPTLLTRLPAKLVASYLGINKDVFSRLRSQI